jgi:hypothetical protein
MKLFYCSKLPPRYLMNGHSIIKFAAFGSGFLNASSDPCFDLFIPATRKWSAAAKIHTHTRSRKRDGVVAFTGAATTSSNKFRLFYFLVARLAHPT